MQEQVTESGPVVVEATDQNFLETVIEESKKRPVVVDLWASWCGPCRTLGPILDGLMRNTPEALRFVERAESEGVRAVVAERDSRFGDYSTAPPEQRPDPSHEITP